jgi:hypothetical protein
MGQCRLVCPLILGDVCGESTAEPAKNNVGTKISKIACFGAKMATFWEKCKIRCKISPAQKAG